LTATVTVDYCYQYFLKLKVMGGSKPTFVPYPIFIETHPSAASLSAVGRCRIHPRTCDADNISKFQAILDKNVEQFKVDSSNNNEVHSSDDEKKKLKKKFMKQGVAMAQSYLCDVLKLDPSIVDVEIVLEASVVIASDGCVVACFLDAGCDKVVIVDDIQSDCGVLEALNCARVPKERLALFVDIDGIKQSNIQQVASFVNCFIVEITTDISEQTCIDTIRQTQEILPKDVSLVIQIATSSFAENSDSLCNIVSSVTAYFGGKDVVSGTIALSDPSPKELGLAYAACIKTDRLDGLFTTVVCTRSGEALGLVYSSKESIIASLECGRGVYYSRSRNGLWRKGDTSGHYQVLHRIDVDCDGDAIRFTVTQKGDDVTAFCHLNTLSCWGELHGVRHLEKTLKDRLHNAPEGSYTKRLFNDSELLRDKLVEEAQELSEADDKQHVAEELADVLYFAMVKAATYGVSIDDAVIELDKRARKVTRRAGDSKAFRIASGNEILKKS
jgi:phosphoribosyl-ATP pyrophosphohydrolase/phosphoribosyl-AMP cyclohydrolase/histidinol dehydrogenase